MSQQKNCVVVLSGGPDSVTVAYWARDQGYNVHGLTFDYGQIAKQEIQSARNIAIHLDIPLKVIDLSSLHEIYAGVTSLVDPNIAMTPTFSNPIIVPFRNAIFLSVAVAYAASINAETIFYGAQGSDAPFYPDCRREFYESFEQTAQLGTDTAIRITAPFSNNSKSDVLQQGVRLNVPYQLTWSCYYNDRIHCGTCESCVNRKNAFNDAGVADPIEYLA